MASGSEVKRSPGLFIGIIPVQAATVPGNVTTRVWHQICSIVAICKGVGVTRLPPVVVVAYRHVETDGVPGLGPAEHRGEDGARGDGLSGVTVYVCGGQGGVGPPTVINRIDRIQRNPSLDQ